MSTLLVKVREVTGIEDHPGASRLKVAIVDGGWKVCIKYDPDTGEAQFKVGDKCVYFPPDSIMPLELSERFGITKYLVEVFGEGGIKLPYGRVHATRLRGVPSYGVIMPVDVLDWPVGHDVKEHYGITKWEPPAEQFDAETELPHPAFHEYTNLEQIGNFPGIIRDGEEVVITEKIHGQNCRLGFVFSLNEQGEKVWELVAGGNNTRRKKIESNGWMSRFWEPMDCEMQNMLMHISGGGRNVIVFGEIYGNGVQNVKYGLNNSRGFRVFDIAVDMNYLSYDEKSALCKQFGVAMVPVLYRGPYSKKIVEEYTDGPTTLCTKEKSGKFGEREGVVITPVVERWDEEIIEQGGDGGRVIFKSLSVDHLARTDKTDAH